MLKDLRPEQHLLFWTLIAITLATRLVVATADFQTLIDLDIYQDDAFYYMKIARNLLDGRGMTFDGTNPTNGYHPLYMLILLPLMALSGDDLMAPIRLSAYALTLVSLLTGFLLFRVGRFIAGSGVAFAALALFGISPYFVAFGVNGQETGVAMLFGVLVVDQYLRGFRPPFRPSRRSAALFGVTCGMAVLARSDLLLLLLAIATDRIVLLLRGDHSRATLRPIALASGFACAIWMAWGLISHSHTGSWLPRSGDAIREIARNYGWVNLPPIWRAPNTSPFFDPVLPPAAFHADVATRLGFVFLFENPLLAPLRVGVPFSVWPALDRYAPYNAFRSAPAALSAACAALAVGAVVLALRRRGVRPETTERRRGFGRILLVYLALICVGYTFYAPGHWYFQRYLTLPILLSTVYGLARGKEALRAIPLPRDRGRILAVAATAALIASQIACLPHAKVRQLRADRAQAAGFLRNWKEIGHRVPVEKKLGSFQAGIYSYFGRRDVFNLDGVVNPAAHEALKEKRLHEYILAEGIDYILDWNWIFRSLCLRHAPPGSLSLRALGHTSARPPAVLYSVAAGNRGDSESGR